MPVRPVPLRIVALLMLVLPLPLRAQRVDVQLREEGSRSPIAGAIVRLLAGDQVVAQALSNEGGRVSLRAPAPGSYRIRVDRIGWVGILTAPVQLGAGQVLPSELTLPATRLELPALEVTSRSRCEGQGASGREAVPVWEEVQKALTANMITANEAATPLHVREFRRWLRRNGDTLSEYNVSSTIVRGRVYASLDPALLRDQGFLITGESDTVTFAVPDAALLVSDDFSATHCFAATDGPDGRVGLTFTPIPGRRLPEVEGTMWVDRATSELAFLEYRYLNLTGVLARAELGGRVDFLRLPTGGWIVKYWHVRTPDIATTEVRGTGGVRHDLARHVGYLELGGRVSIAADAAGDLNLSLVQGRVTDQSIGGGGLPGVAVRVEGSGEAVVTDQEGYYQLAVPVFGEQVVSARHPKLGLLDQPASAGTILSIGDTVTVDFAVPALEEFTRALCGARASNRSGVIGLVLTAAGEPLEGYAVRAVRRTPGGGVVEVRARTNRKGLYGFCDLPADELVTLRVYNRNQPVVDSSVEIGFRTFTWQDLWLPAPPP